MAEGRADCAVPFPQSQTEITRRLCKKRGWVVVSRDESLPFDIVSSGDPLCPVAGHGEHKRGS